MSNLPKIALGAWAWGNDGTFGNDFTAETLKPIFDAAMANGLNLWDTAYAYGMGTSEKVLAGFIRELPRESYLISDKFTPQCANGKPTAMADMIGMQLELMDLDRFDIYWIHNVWDAPKWTEELAKYFEGKENVPMIGVSNHNLTEIKEADAILKIIHRIDQQALKRDYFHMFQMSTAGFYQFTALLHGEERILGRIDCDSHNNPVKKLSGTHHQIKVSVGKWVKRTRI